MTPKSFASLHLYRPISLGHNISCQKDKNDLEDKSMHGKVKSVRTVPYETIEEFGETTKGRRIKNIYSFIDTISDEYIIFNERGNKIEENTYNLDETKWKRTYIYDNKWNMIQMNSRLSDTSIDWKSIYKYDSNGNKIEESWYKLDESLNEKWTYKYDNRGNIIALNGYDSNGIFLGKWTFVYDGNGNKIVEYISRPDRSLQYWIFKYNDKGNMIEWNFYHSDGSLVEKWIWKYDDIRNKIEENTYNSDESIKEKRTYKYKFDDKKNWIKRIDFLNEVPKYIVEREIEYY